MPAPLSADALMADALACWRHSRSLAAAASRLLPSQSPPKTSSKDLGIGSSSSRSRSFAIPARRATTGPVETPRGRRRQGAAVISRSHPALPHHQISTTDSTGTHARPHRLSIRLRRYIRVYIRVFIDQGPQASTASKQAPKQGMLLCVLNTTVPVAATDSIHAPQHYS